MQRTQVHGHESGRRDHALLSATLKRRRERQKMRGGGGRRGRAGAITRGDRKRVGNRGRNRGRDDERKLGRTGENRHLRPQHDLDSTCAVLRAPAALRIHQVPQAVCDVVARVLRRVLRNARLRYVSSLGRASYLDACTDERCGLFV
eukprot:6214224-Pleurochrysis_carterae.AAC.3